MIKTVKCAYASYTPSGMKKRIKWMNECMLRKGTKVHIYVQCFSLFFPSLRGLPEVWHHSWIQLSLKYLQLKEVIHWDYTGPNIWIGPIWWHRTLHWLAAILTWRYIFAEDENMWFFFKALLTWVMTKSVLPLVTTQMFPMTCSLAL